MANPIRQLLSQTSYAADGSTTVWNFSFAGGYIDKGHVKAKYVDASGSRLDIPVTPDMFMGPYQLSIAPAFPAGGTVTIYRDTPRDTPLVDFADKAALTEASLDTNAKQAVFIAAEASDLVNYTIGSTDSVFALVVQAEAAAASAYSAAEGAAESAASAKGYMDSLLVNLNFPLDLGQISDPVINNTFDLGNI